MQPQVLKLSGKRLTVGGKTVFRNSTAVIGGHTYKTVRIGNQEWLAENLKYDDGGEGIKLRAASTYDGEYYYTWAASDRVASSIGDGWRLPSKSDFESLGDAAGGIEEAGKLLKSTSGWDDNGNGIDTFGFAIIAAGFYTGRSGSSYASGGNMGYFWTKTESDESGKAYGIYSSTGWDGIVFTEPYKSSAWFSVRLVRNVNYMATIGSNRYRTVTIGDQEWLAENLREDDGGTGIATSAEEPYAGEKYYTWAAAVRVAGNAGNGWHLPSDTDYDTLTTAAGGASTAGVQLKTTDGWNNGGNGKDTLGFHAYPAGKDGDDDPSSKGDRFKVWTGTSLDEDSAYSCYMPASANTMYNYPEEKSVKCSVRLVRPASIDPYTFIGGRMYKTVKIGSQIWLAENLQLDDGGTGIYTGQSAPYADEHFYTWEAAVRVAGTVSNGWHLPSFDESDALVEYAGGSNSAGKKLKSKDGWDTYGSITSTDEYGFTALPTGRREETGAFTYKGQYATFWTATVDDPKEYPNLARLMYMQYDRNVAGHTDQPKAWAVSVRLVKDA